MNDQSPAPQSDAKPLARRAPDIFDTVRQEIDNVFDRWGTSAFGWPAMASLARRIDLVAPHMNVTETPKEFLIEAELPGVDGKDISVTLQGGILTLRGDKKHQRDETKENYHLSERSFGAFTRQLRLPESADDAKIEAKFQNGVLKIAIPKRAEAIKAERKIEIKKA